MKGLDKVKAKEANHMSAETKETKSGISRRDFIRWGSAGVGVAAVLPLFGGTAEAARTATTGEGESESVESDAAIREREEMVQAAADDALRLLVAPIAAGTKLGAAEVRAIKVDRRGVGIVEITDGSGRAWKAEICRRTQRDANVRPLAVTDNYSLYLYNNGHGSVPTDETVGRAVVAVGDAVQKNEKKVETLALRSRKELWQSQGYRG